MDNKTLILIDAGHGSDTPGKRSPDGKLREYAYAREIAKTLVQKLKNAGYNAQQLETEETDVSLAERVKRANNLYTKNNKKAILISIHNNAAGNGSKWMNAQGWQVCVDPTASSNSKKLATLLCEEASKEGLKIRKEHSSVAYWVQSLYICKHTYCPAVLTENLFQDNKEDVEFLLSDKGKETIVNLHFNAIKKYLG